MLKDLSGNGCAQGVDHDCGVAGGYGGAYAGGAAPNEWVKLKRFLVQLEIAGVKEKTLAAYRAGVFNVILPHGNQRDLRDVPEDIREKVKFSFVDRMDEVIRLALIDPPSLKALEAADAPKEDAVDELRQPRAAKAAGE